MKQPARAIELDDRVVSRQDLLPALDKIMPQELKAVLAILAIALTVAAVFLFRSRSKVPSQNDSWEQNWNGRRKALEAVFGEADKRIATAMPPFYLGGAADVLTFRKHIDGVTYVTASLIGDDQSKPNVLGQYELMICVREDSDSAIQLVSRLARYTIEAVLSPNDTIDVAPALPQPTSLTALLFLPYTRLKVEGRDAAVMLCIGITADELKFIQSHDVEDFISRLKANEIYPFTDLHRDSVLDLGEE